MSESTGNGWGPLEISLVLILGFAIATRFFGLPSISDQEGKNSAIVDNTTCGTFSFSKPKNTDKIKKTSEGFTIIGKYKPCDNFDQTFSFVVIDSRGNLVTSSTPMLMTMNVNPFSIHQYIPLEITPNTGNGFVVITKFDNSGNQVTNGGYRLPINFVN